MSLILRHIGATSPNIRQGPRSGVDTSIVQIGAKVMIASMDPISLIPEIGPEKSAKLSVHGVASDVATSGAQPRFAMFDLNLPPSITDRTLTRYWDSIHRSCRALGISIVGGHTGRFPGCDYTVIGGAVMWCFCDNDAYVSSAMANSGDDLILTKSAAIEATAVLATSFPNTVEKELGRAILNKSRQLLDQTSTVNDAVTAASAGIRRRGVTAMHDVTEGGVVSGILDLAKASGLKATVEEESIPVFDEVRQVCEAFHLDPLMSLGQGCLAIACHPHATNTILKRLKRSNIYARRVGTLREKTGHSVIRKNGRESRLTYPVADPYWNVYWKSVRNKLR
jgi:hydrogenase expression/formation protein HypE